MELIGFTVKKSTKKKKYSCKGKLNEKKFVHANYPQKIFMLWAKKNSYKEFDNEKKFLLFENSPPPPITFLMVRPLLNPLSLTDEPICFFSSNILCVVIFW